MSATCDAAAGRVTRFLGFSCENANPIITLRNPAGLENWTLPILEVTIVVGAILALAHAIRRLRRDGDPTNLALWVGSVVYLFVIEPPLYFPGWFGLENSVGFMFSHNVFTVQFMFDRLPLYIVAFYPALSTVAYEVVRTLGVFAGRGPLAGSVCVALVFEAFYEVFDQLGPQLKWWAWNLDNSANHPLLASVPMNSIWIFASVSFGVLTYFVTRSVGRPTWNGKAPRGCSLAWRTAISGALAPVGMVVASTPTAIFGRKDANVSAQAVVLAVEIVVLWTVGATLLVRQWRQNRSAATTAASVGRGSFLRFFPVAYLIVLGIFWLSALPDFAGATHGVTKLGTPTGSLPYTIVCFVVAGLSLAAALRPAGRASAGKAPTSHDGARSHPV
jgi:hypothetical protein